ncbi:MAG: CusA/CzcA family heavy metal efflux RND transporter [Bryobacteraceae bacterium]|nr:CusA/CzcA family heavy metal efflux RND transporter [Bryobacteraceae bacterium]
MVNRLIDACLDNRWLVLILLAAFVGMGIWVMLQIPIDAFPDLTNNQVVIITECPGMPPVEVEQLVTFPIESTLMGLPKTEGIRSISKLGLSIVTLIFDDSVDTYFARQIVNERLQEARTRIPEGLEPTLGPVATAFGEVYQYTVDGGKLSLMDLKTLHDWQLKYQLRTVRGVNEVNTWGGETRVYTVEVDPDALLRYGITLRSVFDRLKENNANFGGGFIEHSGEQYTVVGLGRTRDMADIGQIVLLERGGTPVLVRDIARIFPGSLPRQGATLRDGKGETVSGMAIMLKGENGRRVIQRVKARLAEVRLPEGVKVTPFYDQSTVIDGTIRTVSRNLLEAVCLVAMILLLFLGNVRAAIIVVFMIPLSMIFGFVGMAVFGVSANLMSLGAIDFGMIVDGSIVMVENTVRRLAHRHGDVSKDETIRHAAHEVARPIVFGVAIIIAVYLPILFLEGLEKRMFRPMAITVCSALLGSLLLALFVVPVLTSIGIGKTVREHEEGWFIKLRGRYQSTLRWVLHHRMLAVLSAVIPLAIALGSVLFIGTEFMPRLDEGSILITTRKLPGIALTDSVALSSQVEKVLLAIPEVTSVVTKLGRPDLAVEAMGIYEADVYVSIKPMDQWTTAHDKEGLIQAMDKRLQVIPGMVFNFTQPMAMRLDETVSGIKADVAVKIFGEDSDVLTQLGDRALRILNTVPGAADAQTEVLTGVAELRVQVDRAALARYGLNVTDVSQLIDSTTGGLRVSEMIEGQRRFPISIRLPERYRTDLDAFAHLQLQAPNGERVRLSQVASIRELRGPEVVSREDAQRRIVVQANVRGRDLGSFVAEARQKMKSLVLPPGYYLDWGGQFENQERAMKRLMLVIPLSVIIIFGLLFATFHSSSQALLILLNVPFALVGGIASLWIRGLNLNLSASVGFTALFGVAVLNGIVMVSYINQLLHRGYPVNDAVVEGASMRLRPVLMTALVASLGFLPMALSQAMGSEVQRPLATVVIGGLITSTLLTLYLLPVLYPWFTRHKLPD